MAIKKCICDHDYQDKKHGKKLRVHTKKVNGKYICTVCRKESLANV